MRSFILSQLLFQFQSIGHITVYSPVASFNAYYAVKATFHQANQLENYLETRIANPGLTIVSNQFAQWVASLIASAARPGHGTERCVMGECTPQAFGSSKYTRQYIWFKLCIDINDISWCRTCAKMFQNLLLATSGTNTQNLLSGFRLETPGSTSDLLISLPDRITLSHLLCSTSE